MLSLDGPRPLGNIRASDELSDATFAITQKRRLVLRDGVSDDAAHDKAKEALRSSLSRASDENLDYLASLFIESAHESSPDSPAAWCVLLGEMIADTDIELDTLVGEDDETSAGEPASLRALVAELQRLGVLEESSSNDELPCYVPGARVIAVLEEDGEWHDAVIEAVVADADTEVPAEAPAEAPASGVRVAQREASKKCSTKSGGRKERKKRAVAGRDAAEKGAARFRVRFLEWDKPQIVSSDELVLASDVVDDDDGTYPLGEGECELCYREMPLTFHHLIPKEVHARYVGKKLPTLLTKDEPTKEFLSSHGTLVCRPCHSAIHRTASNEELAASYCTLAALQQHPRLQKWAVFAQKQRPFTRADLFLKSANA